MKKPYSLFVLLSSVTAAGSLVLTEIAIQFFSADPAIVATIGNAIGGGLLLLLSRKGDTRSRLCRSDMKVIVLAAFCTYAVAYLLSFYAIQLVGAGKIALLGQLETVFVVLMAVLFLGEQLSARRWLAGLLALCGAVLINVDIGALQFTAGLGELLGVLAPLGFAVGIALITPVLRRADAGQVTGLSLLLGALFLLPLLLVVSRSPNITLPLLLVIGAIGLVRATTWFTYNLGLKHIGAAKSAIIFVSFAFFTVLLQAVTAMLFPAFGLQLPTNPPAALSGGLLVALGIIILQTERLPAQPALER